MTAHFEFHYSRFKQAGQKLSEGLDPKDFKRWDDIREASRTAIALEAGIIDTIPHDGRLKNSSLRDTQLLIRKYEICDREVAA